MKRARHHSSSEARGSTATSGQRRGARRFVLAVALAGGFALVSVPVATAAADGTATVLVDVQCDLGHDGVLDLTLVNDRTDQVAVFVVTDPRSSATTSYTVTSLSATAVTFTELSDGVVTVPITIDGADATVTKPVRCDAPVVDVLPAPQRKDSASPSLPATGSSSGGLLIGGVLVAAGMAASLISRRRYS